MRGVVWRTVTWDGGGDSTDVRLVRRHGGWIEHGENVEDRPQFGHNNVRALLWFGRLGRQLDARLAIGG